MEVKIHTQIVKIYYVCQWAWKIDSEKRRLQMKVAM